MWRFRLRCLRCIASGMLSGIMVYFNALKGDLFKMETCFLLKELFLYLRNILATVDKDTDKSFCGHFSISLIVVEIMG